MFPLSKRKLIRGAAAHIAAGLGAGADYVSDHVPLYAPFKGKVETYFGPQGGNWLRLTRINGDALEFAHLSKYYVTSGNVAEGDKIAVTGNTGQITTGPHLHVQIFRDGKRLDPEQYIWESAILPPMSCEQELQKTKEEIRALNTEISRTIKERDDLRNQVEEEVSEKLINYAKWQSQIEETNKYKKKLKACERNKFEALSLVDKIRILFQ